MAKAARPAPLARTVFWFGVTFRLARFVYRYSSGRWLDGRPRTDSRAFHRGTQLAPGIMHAARWSYLPGWQRAAWRLGTPAGALSLLWAYLAAPVATDVSLSVAGAAGAAWGGRRYRRRRHDRKYARPAAAALAELVKQDPGRYRSWIHLPPELLGQTRPQLADRIELPSWVRPPRTVLRAARAARRAAGRLDRNAAGWVRYGPDLRVTSEIRDGLASTVAMKLGTPADDLVFAWRGVGAHPYVEIRPRPKPPELVTVADVRELLEAAPEAKPLLGMAAAKPVAINIDTDAPHIGVSCGSGAGKSILLRGPIAQWLRNGVQVVILDGKQTSQRWCKDLPGVRYCRNGEQMHRALMDLGAEIDARGEIVDSYPAEVDAADIDVGPRIVVIFEEMNIGVDMLKAYWEPIKPKGYRGKSPALQAWDKVLAAGREFRVHAIAIAQLMTVQACGGNSAARENMGPRILGRATVQAWKMLATEYGPKFPAKTVRRGHMHLAFDNEITEFQGVLWTVREARAWAQSGPVTVPAGWGMGSDLRDSTDPVTNPALFTLADAARQEWCQLSYGALRQAASRGRRAGYWPAGRDIEGSKKWTREELESALAKRLETVNGGISK